MLLAIGEKLLPTPVPEAAFDRLPQHFLGDALLSSFTDASISAECAGGDG